MSAQHLTTKQACDRAKVSRFALTRAQKSGELFAVKDNKGRWLWDVEALDAWAQERPEKPQTPTKPKTDPVPHNELMTLQGALGEAKGALEGVKIALAQSQAEAADWKTEAKEQRARADALAARRWFHFFK